MLMILHALVENKAENVADPEQYFGGTQYYNGEPFAAGQVRSSSKHDQLRPTQRMCQVT